MVRILTEPELKIVIVEGIDTICKQCNKKPECEGKDIFMDTHDLLIKWPMFKVHETYRAEDFIKKIEQYVSRND